MSEKKTAGIWLDHHTAIIAKNHDAQNAFKFFLCPKVESEIQQGNTSENSQNNADHTNMQKYFKEIESYLENTEELYITGPGKVQEELKNYLHGTAQHRNLKIILDTAQRMNEEQLLKTVKNYFGARY